MSEKKTADKKAYAAEYRKTHPKTKEEQKEYMKGYIARSESIDCPICAAAGYVGKMKTYNAYKHNNTKKHLEAEGILKAKGELAKREKEEAELLAKAQEEAKKPAQKEEKPKKKKNKLVLVEKKAETPTASGIAKKPVPAPRKKKEEEKPTEKAASLKALEDYSSSDDEEMPKEKGLKEFSLMLQGKKIDSAEVAKFILTHFESSKSSARSTATKTVRLNKNGSLWKKVSAELDGKTFKYLGEHFGEIVAKAYDKPNSQGEFAQMLKMVITHFSKIPAKELDRLTALIRGLKQKQVSEST
jgi:hypothetical protein